MRTKHGLVAMATLVLAACGGHDIDQSTCEPVGDATPICGIDKPEDLALLPDGKTLAVSLYGSMFSYEPGSLALFNTEAEQLSVSPVFDSAEAEPWVNVNCPGVPGPEFSPHGIHYSTRADGAGQLLVVNHGERESIEFFEVAPKGQSYKLTWRGCVQLPENHFANSVAATPEGGFVYSHMFNKDAKRIGKMAVPALKAVLGTPSGAIYEWKGALVGDGAEFAQVPETESGFPNGVEVSADGRYVFFNTSVDGYVHKVDRETGKRVASSSKLPHLDNIRWDQSGQLMAVSMTSNLLESIRCLEVGATINCGGQYQVVRLNPTDLSSEVVYHHDGGQPLGAATVAQQVGDHLYIGSYSGNRLVRVPYRQ